MKRSFELVTAEEALGYGPEILPAPQPSAKILRERALWDRSAPLFCWAAEKVTREVESLIGPSQWVMDPIHVARLFDTYVTGFSTICMTITENSIEGPRSRDVYFADLDGESGIFTTFNRRAAGELSFELEIPDDGAGMTCIDEPAAILYFHLACAHHHSHWIFQALPKIDLLREVGADIQHWVVTDTLPDYQYDAYRLLGIPASAILTRPQNSLYRFRELYACNTWPHVIADCRATERFIEAFGGSGGGPEKIYVSRYDSPWARQLVNEESIAEVAREEGFEVIVPSTLSLEEEVRVFRHAKVITGPLGAGLYNSVFSKPGTRMLAISDPGYMTLWFLQLMAQRRIEYALLFGNSIMSYEDVEKGSHSNWVLDPELFRRALRKVCA